MKTLANSPRPSRSQYLSNIAMAVVSFFALSSASFAQASGATIWSTNNDFNYNATSTGTLTTKSQVIINPNSVTLGSGFAVIAVGNQGFNGSTGYAIKTDGTLWSWGNNVSGLLGQSTLNIAAHPNVTQIGSSTNWVSVAALTSAALAVKSDGTLWGWGDNLHGELGLGAIDGSSRSTPVQIGSDTDWQSVSSTHGYFALALKKNGTLWSWGDNTNGQLGLGDNTMRTSPTQVGTATNWKAVSGAWGISGTAFAAGVRTDGTLWSWGDNTYGQLGLGDTTTRLTPTQVGSGTTWQDVSAGSSGAGSMLGLKTNGTLWSWGYNGSGELGVGDTAERHTPTQVGANSNWQSISAGAGVSFAITTQSTLWSWGSISNGNPGLGVASGGGVLTPAQVGTDTNWRTAASYGTSTGLALGLKTDGTLLSWGKRNTKGELGLGSTGAITSYYSPIQVGNNTNWSSIVEGLGHTLAIKSDGTLWAWGSNGSGQLGLGDSVPRPTPTQVGNGTNWTQVSAGNGFSVAKKADGTIWAWGDNTTGQLGQGDTTARATPTQIGSATNWSTIAAGTDFVIAIKTGGTLWSWGANYNGQLGQGTSDSTAHPTPTQVGSGTTWLSVASHSHADTAYALKTDHTLWTWGHNNNGQLGQGTNDDNPHPTPAQAGAATNWSIITPGANHVLGIQSDHTLWTWGYNGFGQLGQGNTTELHSPTQVGAATNWATAAGGTYFSLAVKTTGTLWAFGYNGSGQLGQGNTSNQSNPTQIGSDTTWANVTAALYAALATKTDGTLWGWGDDDYGQLGYPNTQYSPNTVSAGSIPASGTITNLKLDAGQTVNWTTLTWTSLALPVNTTIKFRVKTSDDDVTYSAYSTYYTQNTVGSVFGSADLSAATPSRYMLVELTLTSSDAAHAPVLANAQLSYNTPTTASSTTTTTGGGVVLLPGTFNKPLTPNDGFKLFINKSASATKSPTVTLTFNAGQDVQKIAVSNNPDFSTANLETYTPEKTWNICSNTPCASGTKTVYAKFYTSFGQESPVVFSTIEYNPQATAAQTAAALPVNFPTNSLVTDKDTTYFISGKEKIKFSSTKVLTGLGYKLANVQKGNTAAYPLSKAGLTSASQAHPAGSWIISKKTVYHKTSTGLIPVPTWELFLSNGGLATYLAPANANDLKLPKLSPLTTADIRVIH